MPYNPGYNPNMPWGRKGSGYFDERRDPYEHSPRRRGRDRWDDDRYEGPTRGSSWDRRDYRDNRDPRDSDRRYDGYGRRPDYYDRDNRDRDYDGRYGTSRYVDDRRPARYVDDYDRRVSPTRYVEPAPVVQRTTYVDPAPVVQRTTYHDPAPVVQRTTYVDPAPVVQRTTYVDNPNTVVTRTVPNNDVVQTTTTRTVRD